MRHTAACLRDRRSSGLTSRTLEPSYVPIHCSGRNLVGESQALTPREWRRVAGVELRRNLSEQSQSLRRP